MAVWQRVAQSPVTTAGTSVSATFQQPTPVGPTVTLVAVLQYSGGAPTATSWPITQTSTTGGNTLAIAVTQGNNSLNGFTATFSDSQAQCAVTIFAFEGFVSSALDSYIISTTASGSTATAGPLAAPGTVAAKTIAIAAVGLTTGGGGTAVDAWGKWTNDFETVPYAQSRMHVGAKALTTAGQTPESTITWTTARASKDAMWVIQGTASANNVLPTVSVGADRVINAGVPTQITATASDPDGTISSYTWSVVSADIQPVLTNANTATVTVTGSLPSTAVLRCTVVDSGSGLASDDVVVEIHPKNDLLVRKGNAVVSRRLLGTNEVVKRNLNSQTIFDKSLVAEWKFSEAQAPFYATNGGLPLALGNTTPVPRVTTPWGYGVTIGSPGYLKLASTYQNVLNVGKTTQKVTVAAWVKRTNAGTGFIAGAWQEDTADPRRSYGMFVNLGMYGGANKSCMHVSKTGTATPGYPYSRDYSASGQTITNDVWEFHVGTYDGAIAKSFLNGAFVAIDSFKDNQNNTYRKNPYDFTDGLNAEPCDFTVGAVLVSSGMSNYFGGDIAKVRVWDRALSDTEVKALYDAEVTAI
jgi:hypothetical protein